jgi:hypothetical protein
MEKKNIWKLKFEGGIWKKHIDEKNRLENDLINSRKSFLFYLLDFNFVIVVFRNLYKCEGRAILKSLKKHWCEYRRTMHWYC